MRVSAPGVRAGLTHEQREWLKYEIDSRRRKVAWRISRIEKDQGFTTSADTPRAREKGIRMRP